ncbi:MAG: hypothetical protein JNM67_11830, partial [Bacteroidetes bacterium]|nr:hypothetical protein [Bacteroidota bacterium]
MKNLTYSALAVLFVSCVSYSQIYQIQEIKKVNSSIAQSELDFKGSHLNIYYNFWEQDKTFSCIIENKSDSLISMDLSLSHFVLNSFAYPYYTSSSS